MRIYHKIKDENTNRTKWIIITDPDEIYVFWLIEVLRLILGESPFSADWGIPATETIATNIYPDYYVSIVKEKFAPYFQYLSIERLDHNVDRAVVYKVEIIKLNGQSVSENIKVNLNG